MNKVKFSALGKPPEHGVILFKSYMVPSHVGYFELFVALPQVLRESLHLSRYDTQALRVVFFAVFKNHLRPKANAHYRLPLLNPFPEPFIELRFLQVGHCLTCRSDAGKDDMACLREYAGIIRDHARFM